MSKYLLIQSQDPYASHEVFNDYKMAAELARQGNDTTLFLVQNGVIPVRKNAKAVDFKSLQDLGVKIICDEFSLHERGIYSDAIAEGIEIGPLDIVIEHLTNHSKTIWL